MIKLIYKDTEEKREYYLWEKEKTKEERVPDNLEYSFQANLPATYIVIYYNVYPMLGSYYKIYSQATSIDALEKNKELELLFLKELKENDT